MKKLIIVSVARFEKSLLTTLGDPELETPAS